MAYQLSQNFFAHAEHARIEDDRQMEIWHSSRLDAQRLHDVLPLRLSADELLEDGLELLVAGQLAEVVPRVPPDVLAAVRQLLAPLADHNLLRGGKYSNYLIVLSVSQYGDNYRVSHVLVDLGWLTLISVFLPDVQPLLPNYHQPKQSRADSGALKIQVNLTQSMSTWDAV